ncbi:T9SS type A sorting domain-containing protein [Lacinutrix cladophorae]
MKTKLLLFLFLSCAFFGYAQQTYVPDDNFENYLETHDASGNVVAVGATNSMGNGVANDDYVTTANINTTTSLDVNSLNIADLTGIEDFAALTRLTCYNNQLTQLDVSANTALTNLLCSGNQLTQLDATANTALQSLWCHDNQLTSLDISTNTTLTNLRCDNNRLTQLDVSANTALTDLICSANQLTQLDVSHNSSLTILNLRNNQLTSLDLTHNGNLTHLFTLYNPITSLDVTQNLALNVLNVIGNQLTSLDVSLNTNLTFLYCENNLLTVLNVKNGNNTNFTVFSSLNNPNLTCIEVDDATWSTTNWTNVDSWASFSENCHYAETYVPDDNFENYLETHDASGNVVAIGATNSMGNGIANDDYVTTANINLVTSLDVNNQNIADLIGIEDFTSLENLNCGDNTLANVDLSQNLALVELDISVNFLVNLDLSSNTLLAILNCSENGIQSLDLSLHSGLVELDCSDNGLINLNVKNGNNYNVGDFVATQNQNLLCIEVDDTAYSTTNWTDVDTQTSFSENCATLGLTYVPDDNFENYLETHDASGNVVAIGATNSMGNGVANDDYVTTANINLVTSLDVNSLSISDLTGIEDFLALEDLRFYNNQVASADFSMNSNLEFLYFDNNNITTIDFTSNPSLTHVIARSNQIISMDLSSNSMLEVLNVYDNNLNTLSLGSKPSLTAIDCSFNNLSILNVTQSSILEALFCNNNQLTNLDVSNNAVLVSLRCDNNLLTSLNAKNGNNINFIYFDSTDNPNLTCIEVDDAAWSTVNWTNKDATSTYVNNQTECATLSNTAFEQVGFNVFPNPVNDMLTVSVLTVASYSLITVNGQVIKHGLLQKGENALNTSNLSNGLYFLQVETVEGVTTKKIVKQ